MSPTGTVADTDITRFSRLTGYRCLVASGLDAVSFLQGQLSSDLDAPAASVGQLSSFNTSRGRVLAVLRTLRVGEAVILVVPAELTAAVAEQLSRFILRARVRIEPTPADVIGVMITPQRGPVLSPHYETLALPADGLLMLIARPDRPGDLAGMQECDVDTWLSAEVAAGLPEVYLATSGTFVPQMLNLDLLGAVSFTKGCYVGQEIVARTHHLGRIKRRARLFAGPAGSASPGDAVYHEDRAIGAVVRTARHDANRDLMLVSVATGTGQVYLAGQDTTLEQLELPYSVPGSVAGD